MGNFIKNRHFISLGIIILLFNLLQSNISRGVMTSAVSSFEKSYHSISDVSLTLHQVNEVYYTSPLNTGDFQIYNISSYYQLSDNGSVLHMGTTVITSDIIVTKGHLLIVNISRNNEHSIRTLS